MDQWQTADDPKDGFKLTLNQMEVASLGPKTAVRRGKHTTSNPFITAVCCTKQKIFKKRYKKRKKGVEKDDKKTWYQRKPWTRLATERNGSIFLSEPPKVAKK